MLISLGCFIHVQCIGASVMHMCNIRPGVGGVSHDQAQIELHLDLQFAVHLPACAAPVLECTVAEPGEHVYPGSGLLRIENAKHAQEIPCNTAILADHCLHHIQVACDPACHDGAECSMKAMFHSLFKQEHAYASHHIPLEG